MEFPIKFDTVQSGWSIVYIEGVTGYNFKKIFLSLRIVFVLANSADPDKMSHYATFYLGLRCLRKYLFWVSGLQRVHTTKTIQDLKDKPH